MDTKNKGDTTNAQTRDNIKKTVFYMGIVPGP